MSKTPTTPQHVKANQSPKQTLDDRQAELCVMTQLLDQDASYPWSVEELIRMIGHRVTVLDAISNLHGAGLLHRIDQYVWPTLAARRAEGLET